MDPSSLVNRIVSEVALDGVYGMTKERFEYLCSSEYNFPLDDSLKEAMWKWVAVHPDISVKENMFFASESRQWQDLTGASKQDNVVGHLTFELLCLIAHSRENGVSTVEASHKTGQDLRSLFGRVQTLVNLGVVYKYPVIENGSSTNRMVFRIYADKHCADETVVDKSAISKDICDYCESGVQGIRTIRDVVVKIGEKLTNTKKNRKRPTIVGCINDLEAIGCLRRVTVIHPENTERTFSCIEFVKPFVANGSKKNNSIYRSNDTISGPTASTVDEDDVQDNEDDYDTGNEYEMDVEPKIDIETSFQKKLQSDLIAHANTLTPLTNQIFDVIHSKGAQGISAMDLTNYLTGRNYKKALGKYLDGITANNTKMVPQLGHLSLLKGVDFNKRVKFYRYFTKKAYSNITDPPEEWGSFLPAREADTSMSLRVLNANSQKGLPGSCSIVKTSTGALKPLFHGDKEVNGETILRSDASDVPGTVAKKKRGRPRKNEKPSIKAEEEPKLQNVASTPISGIPLKDRLWKGGKGAIWTSHGGLESTLEPSNVTNPLSDEAHSATDITADSSIGSLAYLQRVETLFRIIENNNGVVLGGAPLLDQFREAVSGEYTIDRRTVNNLVDKLIEEGRLRMIDVDVSTFTGKQSRKHIIYDPMKIDDFETNPYILKIKDELVEGKREKQILATKAAMEASRNAAKNLPRREMTDEQMQILAPKFLQKLPGRILSTRSGRGGHSNREKVRFGPSAAEVLGIDVEGRVQPKAKRPAIREKVSRKNDFMSTVPDTNPQHSIRNIPKAPVMKPMIDLDVLARSVIVYRCLFSQKGAHVDWKVVAKSMDVHLSATECRRHWQEAREYLSMQDPASKPADVVYRKSEQFEELFLSAYKRNLVQFEPGQNPLEVLPKYVKWWQHMESEGTLDSSAENMNYSTDSAPYISYAAQRLNNLTLKERRADPARIDPLASLQSQVSIVNAEKLLLSTGFSIPMNSVSNASSLSASSRLTDNEMRLRAVIAADEGPSYSPEKAARELTGLTNGETEIAKNGLDSKRVIQWGENDPEKVPAGRPYILNELVTNALTASKLDPLTPYRLADDIAFFINSVDIFDIPATISESEMICLLELSTFGLHNKAVKLKRVGEKFGLLSSDYKSRGIDKHEFECKLVCEIVESDDMTVLDTSTTSFCIQAPLSGNLQRPWLWETRNLSSKTIWFKVAYSILALVHFRPGIPVDALAVHFRNALEYDECIAAVNALAEGGALTYSGCGLFAVPNWFEFLI